MKHLIIALLCVIFLPQMKAQCTPAGSNDCASALVYCSADILDNFSCSTPNFTNVTGPLPTLCNGVGVSQNTRWWGFKGNGKVITLTINVDMSSCTKNKGIQAGVVMSCGNQPVACNADCNTSSFSLSVDTRLYNGYSFYLWVDGCGADVCDFEVQVSNGDPIAIPPDYKIYEYEDKNCSIHVCNNLEGKLWEYDIVWLKDDIPFSTEEYCTNITDFKIQNDVAFDICAIVTVPGPNGDCIHDVKCITIDPVKTIYSGYRAICWEMHKGHGYYWKEADTVIYSSCIDPPCTSVVLDKSAIHCITKYVGEFEILPERQVGSKSVFICDPEELPYRSDAGKLYFESTCEDVNTLTDDVYGCDTNYLLTLEVFDPEVIFRMSCPGCSDSISIEAEINYEPECPLGTTYWTAYWLNAKGERLSYELIDAAAVEDSFQLYLDVTHTDNITGYTENCTIHKKEWFVKVNPEQLAIAGEETVCDKDTVVYQLPEFYRNCKPEWSIEELDGDLIPISQTKTHITKVIWKDNGKKKGRICAGFTDDCGIERQVCKELVWCIPTNNEEVGLNVLRISPNPATGRIVVETASSSSNEMMQFRLYDRSGKQIPIRYERVNNESWGIDIQEPNTGLYLLRIKRGKDQKVRKVIIK